MHQQLLCLPAENACCSMNLDILRVLFAVAASAGGSREGPVSLYQPPSIHPCHCTQQIWQYQNNHDLQVATFCAVHYKSPKENKVM